ncbi:MAG: serine--tRNA ligase [Bradymonadaceae bacterium]
MLDIDFIRDNTDDVKRAADIKGFDVDIDRLLKVDDRRRELIQETDEIRQRRNEIADEIPQASDDERSELIEEGRDLKEQVQDLEEDLSEIKEEFERLMLQVPNVPLEDVPVGDEEADNEVVRTYGDVPAFDFEPKDHETLGEELGIIDKERAIKFAGSRAYLLKGEGAMLEMAIMQLAMEMLAEEGFEPILGPVMVNESAMRGTGWFPYQRDSAYHIEKDDKYLVGTSEVYLMSTHADEILDEEDLPIRMSAKSPCFRREAGSAGRDVRGVYRVHQFTKVEQAVICKDDPEVSREFHDTILGNAETLMRELDLPHRVAIACSGETGLGQVYKNEIETWMPSRDAYCETHSCSSLYDFQARRSGIRYRDEDGEIHYCYTLNNTMAASPRILIPLLECNQNEDGSVTIPEVVRPYMGGQERITPN